MKKSKLILTLFMLISAHYAYSSFQTATAENPLEKYLQDAGMDATAVRVQKLHKHRPLAESYLAEAIVAARQGDQEIVLGSFDHKIGSDKTMHFSCKVLLTDSEVDEIYWSQCKVKLKP